MRPCRGWHRLPDGSCDGRRPRPPARSPVAHGHHSRPPPAGYSAPVNARADAGSRRLSKRCARQLRRPDGGRVDALASTAVAALWPTGQRMSSCHARFPTRSQSGCGAWNPSAPVAMRRCLLWMRDCASVPPPRSRQGRGGMLGRARPCAGFTDITEIQPVKNSSAMDSPALPVQSRGLQAAKGDVVVTSGAVDALTLLFHLVVLPGEWVALEDPGYPPLHHLARAHGANVAPVPVDSGGLSVEALEQLHPAPRLVHLTPSHQFPTGAAMGTERRRQLLAWAFATMRSSSTTTTAGSIRQGLSHLPPMMPWVWSSTLERCPVCWPHLFGSAT